MKTSIRQVKKHLAKRLQQRYDINLSPGLCADKIRSYVYQDETIYIKDSKIPNRKIYLVRIVRIRVQGNEKKILVVYDHRIKCPVTVLHCRESMER